MCHVDEACPRCSRGRMFKQTNMGVTTYICRVCGRIEPTPPPWPNRDRRRAERREAVNAPWPKLDDRRAMTPEQRIAWKALTHAEHYGVRSGPFKRFPVYTPSNIDALDKS